MTARQSIATMVFKRLIIGSVILISILGLTLYIIPKYVFYKNLYHMADELKASFDQAMELFGKSLVESTSLIAESHHVVEVYLNLQKKVGDLKQVTDKNRPIFEKYGNELRREVEPFIRRLEAYTGAKPMLHFHLAGSRSFLRTWRPPKEDIKLDDLSGFRETVNAAQREKKLILGLEPGRDGVMFRSVVPILSDDEVLGSVESVITLQALIEKFITAHPEIVHYLVVFKRNLEDIMEEYIKKNNINILDVGILYTKSDKISNKELPKILDLFSKKKVFLLGNIGYTKIPLRSYKGETLGYLLLGFDIGTQLTIFKSAFGSLIAFLVIFLTGFVFWLTRSIRNSISDLIVTSSAMEKLSTGGGDLTFRLPVRGNNEVSQLASSFNSFLETLSGIIKSLITEISHLFRNSENLQRETEVLEEKARDFKEKADYIVQSSSEILTSSEEVSISFQELSKAISEIAYQAQESANVVKRTVERVNATKEKVDILNRASKEIDEVVNIINGIAEQTNLLALNASIEAARAGEAGKGFAVVANEVKELARQTQEATKRIAERISLLQRSSFEVSQGVEEIVDLIKTVTDASASIASAVEEQTIVMNRVSEHIEGVKSKILVNQDQANGIKRSADEINQLSQKLREVSNQVNEVANTIKAITDQFKIS